MAELAPGQSSAVGLGFGHTATMARTESDTFVVIHGPPGTSSIEIRVTKTGAVVQAKSVPPPPSATGVTVEPRLSVRQYASFRAECIATPEHVAQVRERYGVNEAEEAVETEAWRQKFAAEPSLFELYKRLFQQFRATPDRASPPLAGTMSPLLSTLSPSSKPPRSAPPSSVPPPSALSLSMSGSKPPLALSMPGSRPPVVLSASSEAASERMLTLGQHAEMAAELISATDREAVYQRYGLVDRDVRREVLARCEARLADGTVHDTWKRLYALAVGKLRASQP